MVSEYDVMADEQKRYNEDHGLGEHPEFSPEELAEIRRLAANEWSKVHHIKGETAVPSHRDKLTERLQTLERIEEKTR